MKYDTDTIKETILNKLHEIEEKENVIILHAVESGSRAWGFASPDSDYDVRFIYVRKKNDYLRLEDTNDFIDWELNEVLDINGWDLKKVLKQIHKSNATVFEWANSPVVYYTTAMWGKIYDSAKSYFSCKSTMYHYYGTANKNFNEYLVDDYVKYKKYFYVLRPILACKWIEERKCPPPVLFDDLKPFIDKELLPEVEKLISQKITMAESDKAIKISSINDYLEKNIAYYKNLLENMEDDRTPDWSTLNNLFINSIK